MICCVCGKKQSSWIADYPLAAELANYRLCAECGEKYQRIQNAKTLEEASGEIDHFRKQLAKGGQDETVIRFFGLLLEGIDKGSTINSVLVTSGYNFEGYKIIKYCDYISAEAVFGMGMFKALLASVSSVAGAESEAFSRKVKEAREKAVYELRKNALELGANAIIGIDIDFSMIAGEMVVTIASGTAVVIEEKK